MTAAIRTIGLTKSYGRRPALRGVDLEVPAGVIFGYLGPNGAGKTTTIRLLAGLLRPSSGRAEVFGLDTVRDRDAMQRRIGYLPGDFVAYNNLTAEKYLRYFASLRGGVAWTDVRGVAKRLDLDLATRIGAMSHGNRQKVGIVQSLMHHPDLIILDEPTAGLDPLVQREFLNLLRERRDGGATIFLSSHILSEVETIADSVGILRAGELAAMESIDGLKERALRQIDLLFADQLPPITSLLGIPGVRDVQANGTGVHVTVEGSTAALLQYVGPYGVDNIMTREPDLEEVFLSYYGKGAA